MNIKIKNIRVFFNQLFFNDQKKELDVIQAQKEPPDNFISGLEHTAKKHEDLIALQKNKIEQCNQLDQSLEQLRSQIDLLKNNITNIK